MAIRTYRRPLPYPFHYPCQPDGDPRVLMPGPYEEMFVIMEDPLLEFTQKDLVFLRERGIDPFRD
jgi:hypothetical protein